MACTYTKLTAAERPQLPGLRIAYSPDERWSDAFGEAGEGLIHVHHLVEMSNRKSRYRVDPVNDLVPVCPTCHAMIHLRRPAYTPSEVQAMITKS